MARAVALELGLTEGQHCRVLAALDRFWADKIALVWTHDDVLICAARMDVTLSAREADLALELLWDDYDAQVGVNWDSVEAAIRGVLAVTEDSDADDRA
jgi:hypothetical protein